MSRVVNLNAFLHNPHYICERLFVDVLSPEHALPVSFPNVEADEDEEQAVLPPVLEVFPCRHHIRFLQVSAVADDRMINHGLSGLYSLTR